MLKIAIIGAGLSGLLLASELNKFATVTIFEKSSGVGGRLATRYSDQFDFDHGTQFFTVSSPKFKELVNLLMKDKVVELWNAKFVEICNGAILKTRQWGEEFPHYVGIPRMTAIPKYLAKNLDIKLKTRVASIKKISDIWTIYDDANNILGNYDLVISSAPAPQTLELFPKEFAGYQSVSLSPMTGCFALMLGYNEALTLEWQAALVKESIISWVSVNNSKPGRNDKYTLLMLCSNSWADQHKEKDKEWIKNQMLIEGCKIIHPLIKTAAHIDLHHWRYANASKHDAPMHLFDTKMKLAACGDWCVSGRVQSAFLSAQSLAEAIQQYFQA